MLEYARWKYILVGCVLLVALILALPTVFGQAPALQIARKDRADIDATAQATIEKFLAEQKITAARSVNEPGRLTLLFKDVPEQLRARDAFNAQFAQQNYVSALTLATKAPAFFGKIGLRPMSLGLDLRVGLYLLYQVDVSGAIEKVLDDYEQQMRRSLAESKTPFIDITHVTIGGGDMPNALRVTLPPNADADAVRAQ